MRTRGCGYNPLGRAHGALNDVHVIVGDAVARTLVVQLNPYEISRRCHPGPRQQYGLEVVLSPLLDASGVGYEGLSRYYDLEMSDMLAPGSWSGVPGHTNMTGSSGELRYSIPAGSTSYYRCKVRLVPTENPPG